MHEPLRPRISCSTGSLYHLPLAVALRLIRDAGFDGAEVVGSLETLARGKAAMARIVARAGIPALSFHPPLYPFPGWPLTQAGRAEATMEHARALGSALAVIHAPKSWSMATPRALEYIAAIDAAQTFGAAHGIVIGLETTQKPWDGRPPMLFDDLSYFMRFVAAHDLAVTFDTSHAAANGDDLPIVLGQIGARLRNIHFSDCGPVIPGQRPKTHLRPGMGTAVDLAAFTRDLTRTGYTGLITLEISPLELRPWSLPAISRRLAQARAFVAAALADAGNGKFQQVG